MDTSLIKINSPHLLQNIAVSIKPIGVINAMPALSRNMCDVFPPKTEQSRCNDKFACALKKFDEERRKLNEEYERERKIQEKKNEARRILNRRIVEVEGLIAHYKFKLSLNKDDKTAAAMISSLNAKITRLIVWG